MARLLIVDDEKSLCQMLEIVFRKDGHLVETVSSGQAAKKKIESQVYDLIISDIRMPDLTGIELLEFFRESRNPAGFILITAVPHDVHGHRRSQPGSLSVRHQDG